MAATEISSYYAKFGFKIDTASVSSLKRKISEVKEHISKQLNISVKVSKFSIDKRELNRALKSAVNESGGVHLPINSFAVNAIELRKAVQKAFNTGVTLRVNATANAAKPRTGSGSTNSRTGNTSKNSIQNSLSRYGVGSIAGLAAGYGLMGINQRSEDLQSAKVSLNTITGGRGVDAFQWIKNQGNAQGFDYASQLPMFSNYLGASINKQGYDNSLQSFSDISQYGLTHGANNESMKHAMLAIGQMWSKGKIMAEEVNTQLAEAQGFSGAKAILAESYQESMGGKLTGQKAEAALMAAMKKGLVISEKVMPIFSRRLGEQAAGGREAYLNTTGAQHNRLKNSISGAVEIFGKGGFDEGMMRFFKFMADFLDKHSEDIRNLGKNFLELEIAFERITKGGAPFALLLAGIFKVAESGFARLSLLVAVLDDISVFVNGGDSVLGQIVSYLSELTGLDYNAISVGMGIVGIAVTAAFSPMIAAIAAVGALIEAYKYVQGLKTDNTAEISGGGLPSEKDLREGTFTKARSKLAGTFIGNVLLPIAAGGSAMMPSYFDWIARDKGDKVDWTGPEGAVQAGVFSSDVLDRLKLAVGTGQMSKEQAISYFNKSISKDNNPNIFPNQVAPIGDIYINGTFNNEKVNVMDIMAQFSNKDSQPKDQVPTAQGATP